MNDQELFQRLCQRLEGYRQDMVALQRELVARVAVGPDQGGPGEAEKASFHTDLLKSWGLKVDNFRAGRPGGGR